MTLTREIQPFCNCNSTPSRYIVGKKALRESLARLSNATTDEGKATHKSVSAWVAAHSLEAKDLKYVLSEMQTMHKRIDTAVAAESQGADDDAQPKKRTKKSAKADTKAKAKAKADANADADASDIDIDFTSSAATFLPSLIAEFFQILNDFTEIDDFDQEHDNDTDDEGNGNGGGGTGEGNSAPKMRRSVRRQQRLYLEHFVEFVVDLLSQLPTRRFVRPLLEDVYFVHRTLAAPLVRSGKGGAFAQMSGGSCTFILEHFEHLFPIAIDVTFCNSFGVWCLVFAISAMPTLGL